MRITDPTIRITDPNIIDGGVIQSWLDGGIAQVVVQFSHGAVQPEVLSAVDAACRRFGVRLQVRFYGHRHTGFDCATLRLVPSVRSLSVDSLERAVNIEEVSRLQHLEEFSYGVFETPFPALLESPSLLALRRLRLGESRNKNLDLAPLQSYKRLDSLTILGHTKGIQNLQAVSSLRELLLYNIPSSVSLSFASNMVALQVLSINLGGRTDVSELANPAIIRLEINRVRGFREFTLGRLPSIIELQVEDQPHLHSIDLSAVAGVLRALVVRNCKNLTNITGFERLRHLDCLVLRKTALNAEAIIEMLPKTLGTVDIACYGATRDKAIRIALQERGFG